MTQLYLLSAVVTLYGVANGLLQIANPQAALLLGLKSQELGTVSAGMPLGYAVGCLFLGRVTRGLSGKTVLLGGVFTSLSAFLIMALLQSKTGCMVSMILFGLAGGAFWPFASSWMLDFQSESIPKSRIIRMYNLSWSSGTATGLFCGGLLCARKWIFEAVWVGVGLQIMLVFLALIPKATVHHESRQTDGAPPVRKVVFWALICAVACNMLALASRAVILNNYAELNELYKFKADRIGTFLTVTLLFQLSTFFLNTWYEKYLGFKRTYFILALALIGVNLTFSFATELWILIPCAAVLGSSLAVAFQCCLFASTGFFHSARTATTFHEAMVGVGQTFTLIAGFLIEFGKNEHWNTITALQSPFWVLSGCAVVIYVFQNFALSWGKGRQALAAH